MTTLLLITLVLAVATAAHATRPENGVWEPLTTRIAEAQVALWRCEDQLGQSRTQYSRSPWNLPRSAAYREWTHRLWQQRKRACLRDLHRVAAINRNLYRLAVCETGGINGGLPLWTHHNSVYSGALGFAHSTWTQFKYPGYPAVAAQASPGQQMAVGRVLVERYGGYSSWPACSVRLGLRRG